MENIINVKALRFIVILLLFTSLLGGGLLTYLLFVPKIFTSFNPILVLFLCLSITAPFVLLGGLMHVNFIDIIKNQTHPELAAFSILAAGSLSSIPLFYIPLLASYWMEFNFKEFLIFFLVCFVTANQTTLYKSN